MNLLYDLIASQPNDSGEYHGGGKYAKKVFLELANTNKSSWVIYGLYDSRNKLDSEIMNCVSNNKITLVDIKEGTINEIIKTHAINRFYSALPHNLKEGTKYNCEFVGTVHGLRHLETRPNLEQNKYTNSIGAKVKNYIKILFDDKLFKRDKLRIGNSLKDMKIVAVSNHTKNAVKSYFPAISDLDIKTFYSPDVTDFNIISQPDQQLTEFNHHDYYLMVSGNRWIKNNLRSAIALDELFSEHLDINNKVIITGVKNTEIYLKWIKNKDRFIFYKYVNDDFLNLLYEKAYALMYMSLNEGFGYPPLEAMKYGIPVITSPFTSIPEVCSDAVIYSNPYAIAEIKNRVLQLRSSEMYQEISEKGRNRYLFIKNKQETDLKGLSEYLLSQ
jgi:glycosyltransferase involved in cell wall biosynthesis